MPSDSSEENETKLVELTCYQDEVKEINNNNHTDEKLYFDINATTPLAAEVIQVIANSLVDNWQNPSSQYKKGKESKKLINESRQSIASMINASSASELIFVSGGTEANNLVFHSVIQHYNECKRIAENKNIKINQLPHIIISKIEHDSVKLIADKFKKDGIAEITEIEVNQNGFVEIGNVIDSIKPNTILISIMLANNETGVIQPVKEICAELNKQNYFKTSQIDYLYRMCPLFFHTDAAQAIGKIKVDIDELQVDYLTIVGHKFYGPKIGALYARNCLKSNNNAQNEKIAPIHHQFSGANQENGLRPGTENTPMIIGLGKAAELVTRNLEKYYLNMKEARDYLEIRLIEEFGLENLKFNGKSHKSERLPNTCNVSFIFNEDLKGFIVLGNAQLIEASTGACCHSGEFKASKILLAMQIDKNIAANAIRLSVGRDTTRAQVDLAVKDLRQSINKILS